MRIANQIGVSSMFLLLGAASSEPPAAPTLTAPTDDALVVFGETYTLSATSTDGDLTRIDWVLDPGGSEVVIGTDSTSGYSQSWVVAEASGAHTLVARAVRGGQSTDSAPIDLTVFNMEDLTAPAYRWRADSGVTENDDSAAEDTDPVKGWACMFGLQNLAQGNATFRPVLDADGGPNGTPCLTADGTNDAFVKAFTLNQPAHIWIVCKANDGGASDTPIDGATLNTGRLFRTGASSTTMTMWAGAGVVSAATTPEAWHYYEMQINGATSKLSVDGGAYAEGNAGAANPGGVTLFAAGPGSTAFDLGSIAEVIGLSAIASADEIAGVRAYMAAHYQL